MIRLKDDEFIQLCDFMKTKYGINLYKKAYFDRIPPDEYIKQRAYFQLFPVFAAIEKGYWREAGGGARQPADNELLPFYAGAVAIFNSLKNTSCRKLICMHPIISGLRADSSGQECYTLIMRLEDQRKPGCKAS